MSEETNSINPADLQLPRDFEDDLDYRLPEPFINSTDTSDNEDKSKSGETTPINDTTTQPIPPTPLALLKKLFKMTSQGTGGNTQQLGQQANPKALRPNIADIADQLADLKIDPQKANYLAPDDIVKTYRELEVQYHKDKINKGNIICAILDFVKTLKDLPQEFNQFVEEIKKDTKQVTELCDLQELSLSKAKEISELYSQLIKYPVFRKPDNSVNPNQLTYAK